MGLEQALDRPATGARPRFDLERGVLVGSECEHCGSSVWPARAVCHRCGGWEVREAAFAPTARLITFTEVHVPRPGLEVPYTLGQVALDGGGPLLFGRVRGLPSEVELPCPVRVVVSGPDSTEDSTEDGTAEEGLPTYWFEPAVG